MKNEHFKFLTRNFKNVELGLLKEFLFKGLTKAAIDQIESDCAEMMKHITMLRELQRRLENEESNG